MESQPFSAEVSSEKYNPNVRELQQLVEDTRFKECYVELHAQSLSDTEYVAMQNEIKKRVTLYTNTKLTKEEKRAMGENGENIPLYVKTQFVLPEIERESKDRVEQKAMEAREELEAFDRDFEENKNNPELINALESWGRTPNLYGDWGENDSGYNAGVVHFFQYRSDKAKLGRFKNYPLTIRTFIDMTEYLKTLLNHGEAGGVVQYVRRLKDSEGQEQVFILDNKGWLLVGFKNKDEEMKIVSYFPADRKKVDKAVQEYLGPKDEDSEQKKRRFNALKGEVEEVTFV